VRARDYFTASLCSRRKRLLTGSRGAGQAGSANLATRAIANLLFAVHRCRTDWRKESCC